MSNDAISILVIDDDPDMLWVLNKILSRSGYTVTTTSNPHKALDYLQHHRFMLALIDMKLPNIDGLQLALKIKAVAPKIAIIIISGYYYAEDPEIDKELNQNLCAGFLAKPFGAKEVRSAIEHAFLQKYNKIS